MADDDWSKKLQELASIKSPGDRQRAARILDILRNAPSAPGKVDKNAVIAWLAKNWGDRQRCPICEYNTWGIGDDLVNAVPYLNPSSNVVYPLVVVVCNHCGYTLFFNAVLMGLVPPVPRE